MVPLNAAYNWALFKAYRKRCSKTKQSEAPLNASSPFVPDSMLFTDSYTTFLPGSLALDKHRPCCRGWQGKQKGLVLEQLTSVRPRGLSCGDPPGAATLPGWLGGQWPSPPKPLEMKGLVQPAVLWATRLSASGLCHSEHSWGTAPRAACLVAAVCRPILTPRVSSSSFCVGTS